MALNDFATYIRERMRVFSEDLDVASGSPFDTQVVQPILRRIGTDPFTIDAASFVLDRLSQEFPDLAASDVDAISDLLVKPALLLWDPILREIQRVKLMISLKDPATLTLEEADALGANLFSGRRLGKFARGVARIYLSTPQPLSIGPNNFFTSRTGLHFFPLSVQSWKAAEVQLNRDGDLYYVDVNVQAEAAGDGYNIGPSEIVSVANLASPVRVTNTVRFKDGEPEEDAAAYIGRLDKELTEKSLVTERGLAAQLPAAFPEITRLATTGYRDTEMQRDVIKGGGLGRILLSGTDATVQSDGTLLPLSTRISFAGADLSAVGPVGPSPGLVLTLFDSFSGPPLVRDLRVARILNSTTVELEERVLALASVNKPWTMRRNELTLSSIPGGILFPNRPDGTLVIRDDEVHVGGCFDSSVRGSTQDSGSLLLDTLVDESPVISGTELNLDLGAPYVSLLDLVLDTDYSPDSATYRTLEEAALRQFSLEIQDGPAAGVYRILETIQTPSAAAMLLLDPTPISTAGAYRYRMMDVLDINLVEPREVRIASQDGKTTQGVSIFTTDGGTTDFDALGVSPGDVIRLLNGEDKGDFTVVDVVSPLFTTIEVDKNFGFSSSSLSYEIFRPNSSGGIERPLLRITRMELLDTAGQPVGTPIPYARPVLVRSRSFANTARGIKVTDSDGSLGILSVDWSLTAYSLALTGSIVFVWDGIPAPLAVPLAGVYTPATLISALNVASQGAYGFDIAALVENGAEQFVGILPVGSNVTVDPSSTLSVRTTLFGDSTLRTSRDVRASAVPDWGAISPALDTSTDLLEVLSGYQLGFYSIDALSTARLVAGEDFYPQPHIPVRVGSRSLGSARVYFLDPTSAEVDEQSSFTASTDNGTLLYIPDPQLAHIVIPAAPNGAKPTTGQITSASFSDSGVDFIKKGIRVGDEVVLDLQPLTGTANLSDPVLLLAALQIVLSVDNGSDKTVTFINDVATPGAVSRSGIAEQINASIGQDICSIVDIGGSNFRLRFNANLPVTVRANIGIFSANLALGFPAASNSSNASPVAGIYEVTAVSAGTLTVSPAVGVGPYTSQGYQIRRPGSQRISTTQMAEQTENGLYYWDVELVSQGSGDAWNIAAETDMAIHQFRSDGYWLSTPDENTSFSPSEKITLHISRSVLENGVDDDQDNATLLSGQRASISYEWSALVAQAQNFLLSEEERVVCANPLSKHLVPHFVRLNITYTGGPTTEQARAEIEEYLKELLPDQILEASDIQNILLRRGATSIRNPLDLQAIVVFPDRSMELARSQDTLSTGRLSSFLVDDIVLTRTT